MVTKLPHILNTVIDIHNVEHMEIILEALPSKELDSVLNIEIKIMSASIDAKFLITMFIPESKNVEIVFKKDLSFISPLVRALKSPFKSSVGKNSVTFCGREVIKELNSVLMEEEILSSTSFALTLIVAITKNIVVKTINLVFFILFQ